MHLRHLVVVLPVLFMGQTPSQPPVTGALRGPFVADMDRSVNACTDFPQFTSGNWHAANPIPASMVRWSRRWKSGEDAKSQLKDILDDVSQKPDWPQGSVEQLLSDHYGACMNEEAVNALGVKPIAPMMAEIDQIVDRAGVQRMITRLHRLAITAPFGLTSRSDNHNPENVIAYVYASGLGLPDRDYYLKKEERFVEARQQYREHIVRLFGLAGYPEAEARAASDAVASMETSLAEASLDNVALRDPRQTDNKTTFAELQRLAPDFDWTDYYKAARITPAALNVTEPKFLKEVDRQLKETPIQTWKNYLKWQLLASAAPSLAGPLAEESFRFNEQYLGGAKEMKPRWKRCVESTDSLFGEALGKKYTDKFFPPEAKKRMQGLVRNLFAAMDGTIRGLDWMGPETKKKALEKLATFNPKIGYPDTWKDYSKVEVSRKTFWLNVAAGREWNVEDDWRQINSPVDRGRWRMTPPTSNAYYSPRLNEIVFPAGILQPPVFDMSAADAINYGSIGVIIGHEISHGFDDQGAQYDAHGRLSNWWNDDDLTKFRDKGACVVKQFEEYFIEPGIHHNGKLVLGESIGDLAGAKIAYRALQIAQKTTPGQVIDGFTPDQQFFIAWGQVRYDNTRPETQRLMVQSDPHPVSKFRVIGPLSNLPEFQKAFGCKADDAMVRAPSDRCQVW
jgi:endothelin-converting enzyme/putative endopeptidase